MLRFDVETIYKATNKTISGALSQLRFDVETIYKATSTRYSFSAVCCGLM